MQSNDNNINLDSSLTHRQDPLDKLPQELITHSLLFLSPTSRCVSNAISKSWRHSVLFIPLLHQEIDLSKMGKYPKAFNPRYPFFALGPIIFKYALLRFLPVEDLRNMVAVCRQWREFISLHRHLHRAFKRNLRRYADKKRIDQILLQLDRLSSLALNRVAKISINLSTFFDNHRFWNSGESEWESIGLGRLLTALRSCEGTLGEIRIKVDPFNPEDMQYDTTQVIFYLLEDLLVFERLEHVQIVAPSLISLEAGEDIPGSKYFCLNNNDFNEDLETEMRSFVLVPIINHVKAFFGTEDLNNFPGFTSLVVENRTFEDEFSLPEETAILGEVESSRATLETLGISFVKMNALELWDTVTRCCNLTSLSLHFPSHQGLGDQPSFLPVPLDKKLQLKRLALKSSETYFQVDWAALASWAGEHLEEIKVEELCIQALPGQPSSSLFSILINSKRTLRSIELDSVFHLEEKLVNTNIAVSFPNLKVLHISFLSSFILDFFSHSHYPNLADLMMKDCSSQSEEKNQIFLDAFLTIIHSSSSSLIKIRLGQGLPEDMMIPLPPSGASLPRLEKLDIWNCRERFLSYFSNFKCPNLVSVRGLNNATLEKFGRSAPKLWISNNSTDLSEYYGEF